MALSHSLFEVLVEKEEKEMLEWVHEILYVIIVATVPVVAKFVIAYLDSRKKEIESQTKKQLFDKTVLSTISLIQDAVDTTSQTYVDSLKGKGQFDKEAQIEAFRKSFDNVKVLMDNQTKEILSEVYCDLDKWIEIQIESYVRKQKKESEKQEKKEQE